MNNTLLLTDHILKGYKYSWYQSYYTGWPRKNATLTINDSITVFLRQCHFQSLPLLSQKSRLTYTANFHCLAPPGKVPALALKNKDSMNKEKHHYVTLQRYNPGEATERNSSRPQSWLLIEKKHILKMTLPQQNGSRIKTPSSKLILVSVRWKKNFLRINALTNLI